MRLCATVLTASCIFLSPSVTCAAEAPANPKACAAIDLAAERLACYDLEFPRAAPAAVVKPDSPKPRTVTEVFPHDVAGIQRPAKSSLLDSRWELDPDSKLGAFHVRAYRPVYMLPLFQTSDINATPSSPSPGHTETVPERLNNSEVKFQLSFKTKAVENLFGDNGDIWLGYTQTSHWQIGNSAISRPFRETNYEPEAMLVFRTDYRIFGLDGRLLGIGVDHQSNGRSLPLSRSWNRVIANVGFEHDDWALLIQPWWRIPESESKDDNPDIEDYVGHGSLQFIRAWKGHEFSLLLRPSNRGGALQLDWGFPIKDELRGHLQVFDGYGESLIDYNHRALYVGVGVSLLEWF